MTKDSLSEADDGCDDVLARMRALTATIRERAAVAEEARTVPRDVIDALLAAGITHILIPQRFGGYGRGLDTWFEVVREIGKADASGRLVREPDDPPPALYQPICRGCAERGLGRRPRRSDRSLDPAVGPGHAG
jgi:hypothetical protein